MLEGLPIMNLKNSVWIRSIVIAGAGLLALPAFAAPQQAVLGNGGELYLVKTGTYGALFPDGTETDPGNSVLALEITRPGEPAERVLVADTKDRAVESSPAVIFEADTNTIFMVWESRPSSIQSSLRLASFDGAHWSPAVEVTGNSYSEKTSLQLATTRDSYQVPDIEGRPVLKHREILHLTWSEENEIGLDEAFYTPIILDEGAFIGANPILSLNTFDPSDDHPAAPVSTELVRSPMVQAGRDGRTVMVSFTSAVTGRLLALEVAVLPTQLRQLADKARAYIIELGARAKPDLPTVAAKARDFILSSSGDFQPEVARSMADLLYTFVLNQNPSQANLAEKARAYIIELGAKFSGRPLRPAAGEPSFPAQILQIVPRPAGPGENPPGHLLQVRAAFSRRAPAIGNGTVRVFVSETGASSLVSWTGDDRVYYRDSVGNGWSDVRELKLNESFNLDKGYEVLSQRVQNR